jgi:hypothetical protein
MTDAASETDITESPYFGREFLVTMPDGREGLALPEGGFFALTVEQVNGLPPMTQSRYARTHQVGIVAVSERTYH